MATIYITTVTLIGRGNKTFSISEEIPACTKMQANLEMLSKFSPTHRILSIRSK